MQNKINLDTHNEVIPVNEPWHRGSGFTWMLLALAGVVFFLTGAVAKAQETVYWRSAAPNANWANANDNNWYRSGDGWDVRRPDLANNQWSTGGTRSYNVVIFDNGSHATTTVNAEGGAKFDIYQLLLRHSSSRTFDSSGGGYFSLGGGSGNAKIETESGATGTYTFNVPLTLAKTTEINAVNGNMVFNSGSTIDTDGHTLQSYTSSGKQLELKGPISDSGGFQHKGGGLVILEGNNTYSGATTVEANGGVLQIKHASALGSIGNGTTVSSGSALETYGSLGTVAEALTISGDGVSGGGALRNLLGSTTWSGSVTLGGGARINSDAGSLTLSGGISGADKVLYLGGSGDLTVSSAITGSGNTQDGTTTSLFKDGSGTLTLTGSSSYSGDTRITGGTLTVNSGGNLGNGNSDIFISGGAVLNVNTSLTVDSVQESASGSSGVISIGTGAVLAIDGADKGILYQNSISGAGGLTMAGSGSTSLSLFGTQSYTGATTISGGKISSGTALASTSYTVSGGTMETSADSVIANNSAISISGTGNFSVGGNDTIGTVTATGGKLTVADGKTAILSGNSSIGSSSEILGPGTIQVGTATANSGTLTLNSTDADNTSALSVASGGTLSGTFRTSGALSVDGVLAPGNSTGTSYAGNTTFLGGGNYEWEIDNFTGSAGSSWDFLSITGTLTISATSADRFLIDVISLLSASDLPGLASNFSDGTNYSFAIATASGGVSGWAADKFDINTSGFQNAFTGTWGTSVSGNSLNITYTAATAIPEPSSAALTLIGLGVLALRRRCG